jgi:hypothetical protein
LYGSIFYILHFLQNSKIKISILLITQAEEDESVQDEIPQNNENNAEEFFPYIFTSWSWPLSSPIPKATRTSGCGTSLIISKIKFLSHPLIQSIKNSPLLFYFFIQNMGLIQSINHSHPLLFFSSYRI